MNFMARLIRKFFYYMSYLISAPAACCIVLIFPFLKIRFVKLHSDRIGHYSLNTELLLCTLDTVSSLKKKKYLFYVCSSYVPICNTQLHAMWKRVMPIFPYAEIAAQLDWLLSCMLGCSYTKDMIKMTFERNSGVNDVNGLLEKNPTPHLRFSSQEIERGEQSLIQLGISSGAKFICLMARDAGYLKKHLPDNDWSYHGFRNVDVMSYKKAALYLAEKGYYVVRMGKHVEKEFSVQHPRVIDYAMSSMRSDFMDIYLLSKCYFFITTSTGIDCVPQIFRRPGVFTNIVLPGELLTWYPNRLFIPKRIKDRLTGKFLSFNEIYNALTENKHIKPRIADVLKKRNLEVVDNTEDELLEVVKEMEKTMSGELYAEKNNEEPDQFWNIFPGELMTGVNEPVYSKNIKIRLGEDFLRKINGM